MGDVGSTLYALLYFCAVPCCAVLCCAVLCCAVLCCAYLCVCCGWHHRVRNMSWGFIVCLTVRVLVRSLSLPFPHLFPHLSPSSHTLFSPSSHTLLSPSSPLPPLPFLSLSPIILPPGTRSSTSIAFSSSVNRVYVKQSQCEPIILYPLYTLHTPL